MGLHFSSGGFGKRKRRRGLSLAFRLLALGVPVLPRLQHDEEGDGEDCEQHREHTDDACGTPASCSRARCCS